MARDGNRRRVNLGLACETLEPRQLLAALSPGAHAAEVRALNHGSPLLKAPSIFIEPQAGRAPILQAIASARDEIRLGICNLSDPIIGQALADAVARGVSVRVIVDRHDYDNKPPERVLLAQLAAEGVSIHVSNAVFTQSFEKDLVIDQRQVLIMTMCLVPETFQDTRDYGMVLANSAIIREVTNIFDNDWTYSAPPGVATPPYNPTPPVRVQSLIWGPTNAIPKLTQLIQSARRTIDATTEMLNDPYLESQLIAAAHRGVHIRLILPRTARVNVSNARGIQLLSSQGVDVRVTFGQAPPVSAPPYMHAKTMIVDGRLAYLGSIDLETSATSQSRELGITFRQLGLIAQLRNQFQADWAAAHIPS